MLVRENRHCLFISTMKRKRTGRTVAEVDKAMTEDKALSPTRKDLAKRHWLSTEDILHIGGMPIKRVEHEVTDESIKELAKDIEELTAKVPLPQGPEDFGEEEPNLYLSPSGEVTIVRDDSGYYNPYSRQQEQVGMKKKKLIELVKLFGGRMMSMKNYFQVKQKRTDIADKCIQSMSLVCKYIDEARSNAKIDTEYLRMNRYALAEIEHCHDLLKVMQREGTLSLQMYNSLFIDYKDITRWMNCVINKVSKKVE